ncbi:MAG: Thiosulfate sulfurtransferase GlpE [Candidatus Scalindua arabica]|uniref:Thiosulfate sulfurtransferase GlpE n=1 Tax=Candidatus Scalindua arabica TaxID=1127984 RepID=A0A941W351_9BACT|nr:Thiosulfate sulfurtransferase GlpE [Candidatus Scalindua arabica]
MKNKRFFVLIVMFAITGIVAMSGCSRNQETLTWTEVISDIRDKYPDVNQIRTDELYSWLTAPDSEPAIIIDARAKEEFYVSNITGAMNIPYDKDPLKHLTDIKPDRPIVVYCSVGYRSSILARKLQDAGFTRVYNLEGSIFKWANEGRPLVQSQTTVHKVHPYNAHWGKLLEKKYH